MHPNAKSFDLAQEGRKPLDGFADIIIDRHRLEHLVGPLTDNAVALSDGSTMNPTAPGPMQWACVEISGVQFVVEFYDDEKEPCACVAGEVSAGIPDQLRQIFVEQLGISDLVRYEHDYWGPYQGHGRIYNPKPADA